LSDRNPSNWKARGAAASNKRCDGGDYRVRLLDHPKSSAVDLLASGDNKTEVSAGV
jgi:hypothetical protein